jgi:hypothetical protein
VSFFVKVGTFAKSTGGAPATQVISGLGFTPKAVLLWTSGGQVDGTILTQATLDGRSAWGIVCGTAAADQFSACSTLENSASAGGRRYTQKSFLLTDVGGGTVVVAGVLASFDADGFTLTWNPNNAETTIISYFAIGGTDVSAKLNFQTTPAASGNIVTTGIGFQPNLLMQFGTATTGTIDTGIGSHITRCGAGTGPSARWATCNAAANTISGASWRIHRDDRFVQAIGITGAVSADNDIVSLDADGFTLSQPSALSVILAVLCLKVPYAAVGTFSKPTGGAPAVATVSGLPLIPEVVLLSTDQDIGRANAAIQNGARRGFSAFTAAAATSSVISVPDVANPKTFAVVDKSGKAAVKIDNATPSIDAECTATFQSGGFVLTWNGNDAVATDFAYVALGSLPAITARAPRVVRSRGANTGRKQRGAWRRRAA